MGMPENIKREHIALIITILAVFVVVMAVLIATGAVKVPAILGESTGIF